MEASKAVTYKDHDSSWKVVIYKDHDSLWMVVIYKDRELRWLYGRLSQTFILDHDSSQKFHQISNCFISHTD